MLRKDLGGASLPRLSPQESVAEHLEPAGIGLAARAAKGIHRPADLEINETRIPHHLLPACTRHATSDSSGPKVDVAHGSFRYRLPVGDIDELQNTARA